MNNYIEINGRRIGAWYPVYVVAELSANHNQSYDRAVALIRSAKEAGADAIKLQTYTADTLTIHSDRDYFRIGGGTLWDGRTLYDLYEEAYTPWEWQPKLKEIAGEMELDLFSAPFDPTAVDFLESMGVPAYKVASFEIVDTPLIEYMASKGKPLIISTGMAELSEIQDAVQAARRGGATQVVLLKCNSAYPAPPEEMNLRSIPNMAETFHVPVGLSDHTLGIAVAVAAVALGACMVEKHFTLSRSDPGPDSAFSLEPEEFKRMVQEVREGRAGVGGGQILSGRTRGRQSQLPPLALRRGRREGRRGVHPRKPALNPPRERSPTQTLDGRPWPQGGSGYTTRYPSALGPARW